MPISADRILSDIIVISLFSESQESVGYSRPTFSEAWCKARDYVMAQAKQAGCKNRIDPAGNVHIRPNAVPWDAKVWMSGSHIDSVPTGGKYDGVMGIVCPLEILRVAHEEGRNDLPLELVIFAEEEGTTFGIGMIGSRLWVGDLTWDQLANFYNSQRQTYQEAGESEGVRDDIKGDFESSRYLGLIEIHAEQGPALWNRSKGKVAVVTAIAGRTQYKCVVEGEPNHAGSTPMAHRRDALAATAAVVIGLESLAPKISPQAVMTVGKLSVSPGAINVIPGHCEFTIDFRAPTRTQLVEGNDQIRRLIGRISQERNMSISMLTTEDAPAVAMDKRLVAKLVEVCKTELGDDYAGETVSGALHDAAILAPRIATVMLFVPSEGGISHNPAEFSRIEDIAAAARVLAKVVSE